MFWNILQFTAGKIPLSLTLTTAAAETAVLCNSLCSTTYNHNPTLASLLHLYTFIHNQLTGYQDISLWIQYLSLISTSFCLNPFNYSFSCQKLIHSISVSLNILVTQSIQICLNWSHRTDIVSVLRMRNWTVRCFLLKSQHWTTDTNNWTEQDTSDIQGVQKILSTFSDNESQLW